MEGFAEVFSAPSLGIAFPRLAMPFSQVQEALALVASLLADNPHLEGTVAARFRRAGRLGTVAASEEQLPDAVAAAVERLGSELPPLTVTENDAALLGRQFGEPIGEALLLWCASSTWRRDAKLSELLACAAATGRWPERVLSAARDRVVEGPLVDALGCAPLLGDGTRLALPENAEARARLEILIWEAGASAREVPALGKWLWGSPETFQEMIGGPAHGTLRGRVLAARCLEVSVRGLPPGTDPELIGRTLQVLQPLLLHPEPLVWVHAARALGRLTGPLEQMEGTLLDWALGESRVLRQRAMTAFASLPAERLRLLAGQLISILESRDEEAWVLAAAAAATPYLFLERRDLWNRLAARILRGDGGAVAARGLARGLAVLWRRGTHEAEIEGPLRGLREMARSARASTLDEQRRWIEVIGVTDVVDGAERDPFDLELGLENLMRLAAQYDDEEADARAARFASSVAPTFQEARRIALGTGRLHLRAAAVNALEGCARSIALRLWAPLLATRPAGEPVEEPDLKETWQTIARAPSEILDLVKERRHAQASLGDADLSLEVLAVRLGGYALDACGEASDLGPGRGSAAHDTCLWLRKLDGLADGSRELPDALQGALSALFWRLVDTTRGTALGEVDDVHWLGPFAAWWALVIDRPAMLQQLATALPMMAASALTQCC